MRGLARAVARTLSLVSLVVLTRLAATLLLGVAVARSVAGFIGAHPAGELALFEGGAERLAELAPRLRVHPAWALAAVISYAVLLIIPHGALVVRGSDAAPSAGQALRVSARRTGLLLLVFALALFARVGAVTIAVSAWPRFSGAGSVFLVIVVVIGWSLFEGFASLVRASALSAGHRVGAAFKHAYDLAATARAGLVTLVHLVLQVVVAGLTLFLAARAVPQPPVVALLLVVSSVAALALSTIVFTAAQIVIFRGLPAFASNGLPSSDQVGYETAPSVDESPGSSVGRAED